MGRQGVRARHDGVTGFGSRRRVVGCSNVYVCVYIYIYIQKEWGKVKAPFPKADEG